MMTKVPENSNQVVASVFPLPFYFWQEPPWILHVLGLSLCSQATMLQTLAESNHIIWKEQNTACSIYLNLATRIAAMMIMMFHPIWRSHHQHQLGHHVQENPIPPIVRWFSQRETSMTRSGEFPVMCLMTVGAHLASFLEFAPQHGQAPFALNVAKHHLIIILLVYLIITISSNECSHLESLFNSEWSGISYKYHHTRKKKQWPIRPISWSLCTKTKRLKRPKC